MNPIAEEYKKNNENKVSNLLSKIKWTHAIIFGIVVVILLVYIKNQTNVKLNMFIMIAEAAIIFILYFKSNKEKVLLDDETAKKIAQEILNKKVREAREFAYDSKVFVKPQCHLRYSNDVMTNSSVDVPIAWDVEFEEHVHGSHFKRNGYVSIHPYDGFLTGLFFTPFGFNPKDSKNERIIPVGVVQGKIDSGNFNG